MFVLDGSLRHGVRRLLLVAERQEWCLLVCSCWFTFRPSGMEQPLVQVVRGCCALSACASFWMNFLVSVELLLALFAHGKLLFSTFALVSFSPCSGVWVLPMEYSVLDFSEDPACYMVQQWIHVLQEALE